MGAPSFRCAFQHLSPNGENVDLIGGSLAALVNHNLLVLGLGLGCRGRRCSRCAACQRLRLSSGRSDRCSNHRCSNWRRSSNNWRRSHRRRSSDNWRRRSNNWLRSGNWCRSSNNWLRSGNWCRSSNNWLRSGNWCRSSNNWRRRSNWCRSSNNWRGRSNWSSGNWSSSNWSGNWRNERGRCCRHCSRSGGHGGWRGGRSGSDALMNHRAFLAPCLRRERRLWRRCNRCGACYQPGLRGDDHRVVARLRNVEAAGRNHLVGCEAIGKCLASPVGVDGGRQVDFRAIIQLEGLYGSGFAGRAGTEGAGIGAAMESNGDRFRRACGAAVDQNRHGSFRRGLERRFLIQRQRNRLQPSGIAGSGPSILIKPGHVSVRGHKGAHGAIAQDRPNAGHHRPHIAAGVAA
jgi:hypothetical protein